MSSFSHVPGSSLTQRYLKLATGALGAGDVPAARQFALELLSYGHKNGNANAQAQACLLLSQTDVLISHMKRARGLGTRALALFEHDDNPDGQAQALAVVSYSASSLGQGAEAVDAATRGVALREALDSPVAQAFGYNYLGVASFWAGELDTSAHTLEAAVWFAQDASDDQAESFQPLVNSCFLEVLQVMRHEADGHPADLSRLVKLINSCQTLFRSGNAGALNPAVSPMGLLLLAFASCFASARTGRLDAAHRSYLECRDRAAALPPTSWLHAVVEWAKFELAKAGGDLDQAAMAASRMQEHARVGQHAPVSAMAAELQAKLQPT